MQHDNHPQDQEPTHGAFSGAGSQQDDQQSDSPSQESASPARTRGQAAPDAVHVDDATDSEDLAYLGETDQDKPQQLIQQLEILAQQFSSQVSWSAPLAHHTDMAEYQKMVPDAPERIFRMAEVETVDKSARMDKLADAEIAGADKDRTAALVFLSIFTIASIVFFALGNVPAGLAFMSIPVLGLIKTMWPSGSKPEIGGASDED